MPFTMRGKSGELKQAWHTAATLGPWTLSGDKSTYTLTAQIATADTYRVAQRPLVFEHPLAGKPMQWKVSELQLADGTLTASLVPPDEGGT